MPAEKFTIPEDLLHLKPFDALESVSMSRLARTGSAVLQKLMTTTQAVAVKVQGQGAMVTLSQRQYDEMVLLIERLQHNNDEDDFTQALGKRFDDLVTKMNQPGVGQATDTALFGDTASLNQSYRAGATELDD